MTLNNEQTRLDANQYINKKISDILNDEKFILQNKMLGEISQDYTHIHEVETFMLDIAIAWFFHDLILNAYQNKMNHQDIVASALNEQVILSYLEKTKNYLEQHFNNDVEEFKKVMPHKLELYNPAHENSKAYFYFFNQEKPSYDSLKTTSVEQKEEEFKPVFELHHPKEHQSQEDLLAAQIDKLNQLILESENLLKEVG